MKKTNTIRKKVFAGALAAVCAVSALSTVSFISASAASDRISFNITSKASGEAVIVEETQTSTFTLPMKGIDWNYYADSLNVKVTCNIDFRYNICNFKLTAVKPGTANILLKTKDTYGQWTVTPIRVRVGSNMRMNIVQTGSAYVVN